MEDLQRPNSTLVEFFLTFPHTSAQIACMKGRKIRFSLERQLQGRLKSRRAVITQSPAQTDSTFWAETAQCIISCKLCHILPNTVPTAITDILAYRTYLPHMESMKLRSSLDRRIITYVDGCLLNT